MKKILFITAGIILAFSMTLSACSKDESSEPAPNNPEEEVPATPDESDEPDTSEGERRTLVVYYSHSGNTHTIAGYIKDALESDIVRIERQFLIRNLMMSILRKRERKWHQAIILNLSCILRISKTMT